MPTPRHAAARRRLGKGAAAEKRPGIDDADRVRMAGMSGRALSFGVVAEAYERFRPGYSAELFDTGMTYAGQPVRTAPAICAGTGEGTRVLAQRGVLGAAVGPHRAILAQLRKP